MSGVGRGRTSGATVKASQLRTETHNRRTMMQPETRGVRFVTSLPTQAAGARRCVINSTHAGASGDGNVKSKSQMQFGNGSVGRRLGSATYSSTRSSTAKTDTQRLEKPTISSTMRVASNRLLAKQKDKEKIKPIISTPLGKYDKGRNRNSRTQDPAAPVQKGSTMSPMAKQMARARLWPQRKEAGGSSLKQSFKPLNIVEKITSDLGQHADYDGSNFSEDHMTAAKAAAMELVETGIQTNEAEIIDHKLLVGNIKLMMPSPKIVDQIMKMRHEAKLKQEKQSIRRFADHEQHEEMHLTELKEFTERNCVTKRSPKKPVISFSNFEQSHATNVFKSMDEFLAHDVPKSESLSNIKERIKRKEQELLSLFDDVDLN